MFSPTYRRYVLGSLMLVNAVIVLDRGLIGLLLQPIKEDLHLTDANLGFLTGIAFGLFYATLGLPIARWADRGNRVNIVALAIALWGVTVMLCLWVSTFAQLVAARIAAAIGEAGGAPPTYSLVGDYFPGAAARTRAMTIYVLSDPIAVLISFILGGWLNEHYGWRMTFFVMGIPALLIAVIIKMTIAEPRSDANVAASVPEPPPILAVVALLWRQRTTRSLIVGIILLFTMGLGLGPWQAAFLMRTHGLGTAELGVWLGIVFSFGGIAGILLGGYAAERWFTGDERGQLRLCALIIAVQLPCLIVFLIVPIKAVALLALVPAVGTFNAIFGPTYALMQRLVPDEIRATTMAVVLLLANLVGMGVGPQIIGLLSDVLAPAVGGRSLQYAMLAMSTVSLGAATYFWRAGATVRDDLAARDRKRPMESELCPSAAK